MTALNFELKPYQERALDTLREYLATARHTGAQDAFLDVTGRLGGRQQTYIPVQCPTLGKVPYVCMRVPTGGGKTVMACWSVGIALKHFLCAERGIVLWLVPSNTILDQTARALDDPRHPYHRALESNVGPVEIVAIDDAMRMSRATVAGSTIVIVATIQCFRVTDKTGRLVYTQEGLADHFTDVPPERVADLERGADGKPKGTLINLLRLHNPIVVVDEAHNARTKLSFDALKDVQPACIIEFTATPAKEKNPSNVLHRVSAMELKAADMIKMPLLVETRKPGDWESLLSEAVAMRDNLEKHAALEGQETKEYIRPIMLIQARTLEHTKELKTALTGYPRMAQDEVRICTSEIDEIGDMNQLASPNCPIRYIITVQKLREGWDCPFAYVLCSLNETRSETALEQIVGRIMRLPSAARKYHDELNKGYAFSVSPSLPEVLGDLKDALVNNGFTSGEAEQIVIPANDPTLPLFTTPVTFAIDAAKDIDAALVTANSNQLAGKVSFDTEKGSVTVLQSLTPEEKQILGTCFVSPAAAAKAQQAAEEVAASEVPRTPGPPIANIPRVSFCVPRLSVVHGEDLLEFEKTDLLERPWRLSEKDATLGQDLYPTQKSKAELGIVSVAAKGDVKIALLEKDDQDSKYFAKAFQEDLGDYRTEREWSYEELIQWIDANIRYHDIPIAESALFIRHVLNGLMADRGIRDVATLVLDKYRLRDAINKKIDLHRKAEHKATFDALLLPESPLAVDERNVLDFNDPRYVYEPGWSYDGDFVFRHHYFGPKPGELYSAGEEHECAIFLDGHDQVQCWVRNIVKRASSFSLQTSTDRFYPDFVCLLKDGRYLVVEYKGKDRWDGLDSTEKRLVGKVWEGRSKGKCLFVMPEGKNLDEITRKINQGR